MESTEQKVSRLHERVEAAWRLILRHADRHGGGGPDPTKITTSSHPRLHTMTEALDHSGAISAAQHASQTTGDLHPEYVQETLLDSLIPDPLARVISKTHATSGTTAFSANITGDTQVRTAIQASGGYVWGSGAAPVDVVLSRIAADKLGLAAGDTWQSDTAEHDHINEKTTDHGVVIDSVPLKDGLVDGRDVSADGATLDDHNARHEPGGGDPMAVDAAAATGSLRTIGTGALTACAGNDARLSNKAAVYLSFGIEPITGASFTP